MNRWLNNKGKPNNLSCPNGCKNIKGEKIFDGKMLVCNLCGGVMGVKEFAHLYIRCERLKKTT